ncbi:MAG: diguanylate cyclase [Spirochaetales bacterium]|nr:diguanylate cyclase [Spirochaetales bacterium]
MEKTDRTTYDLLFEDEQLRETLSEVGVFASHYISEKSFSSDVWRSLGQPAKAAGRDLQWLDHVHPDDRKRVKHAIERVYNGETEQFEETFRLRRRNGTYRWVISRGRSIGKSEDGFPILYVGADTDVSRFKTVETRLQQQYEELETLRQVIAVIGSSLDMEETVSRILEQTRRVIPYDTATVQILDGGYLRVVGGTGFEDISRIVNLRFPYPEKGSLSTRAIREKRPCYSHDLANDFPAFVQPTKEATIQSWMGMPLIRRGEVIGLLATDSLKSNAYSERHLRLAATIADHIAIALENARLHDQTYQLAMSDPLTGAGSRRRFQVEGRLLYENAVRTEHPIAVAMLDADHFKEVNDRYGHEVGDQVLRRIAAICFRELRSTDLFARFGGEEFVIVFPDATCRQAYAASERICRHVREIDHPDVDWSVTVSIGVACETPNAGRGFDTLVRRADDAMYMSKDAGRNRVTMA